MLPCFSMIRILGEYRDSLGPPLRRDPRGPAWHSNFSDRGGRWRDRKNGKSENQATPETQPESVPSRPLLEGAPCPDPVGGRSRVLQPNPTRTGLESLIYWSAVVSRRRLAGGEAGSGNIVACCEKKRGHPS